MLPLKSFFLFLLLIELHSAEEVTASSNRFITLTADCSQYWTQNGSIELTLHTSEPFYGSLYSRNHPSSCKSLGNGGTATKLQVTLDKECGVTIASDAKERVGKRVSNGNQENAVESKEEVHQISLYVQHDEHVQQVIDEQFLVQCWKGMAQGLVSYQDGFTNFFVDSKTLSKSMTTTAKLKEQESVAKNTIQKRILDMVPMEPMVATRPPPKVSRKQTGDLITASSLEDNMVDIGTANSLIEEDFSSLGSASASGWMELVNAESGEALTESTQVGTRVSLVIRLKQMASMDTMLSTCTAHSGDDFYDLTNFRGCTSDADILPNFKAFFNSRTGVKRLTASFPMFKFPDQTKVTIRCTVMVCNKNCPVAKCSEASPSDFKDVKILDKFYLDTFAQVHDSAMKNHQEQPPQFLASTIKLLDESDQLMRTPPLRSEEQGEHFSNYHKSTQQQVESAAVSSKEQVIIQEEETEEEEDLLCLSPSRLALAFGILLVILLLALVASCTMWMRARSHLKRPSPSTIFAPRPPRPHPPAGTLVPAPPAPRGPFMVASRGAPYIRVVQ